MMRQLELMRRFEKILSAQSHKFDKSQVARGVYRYKDIEMNTLFRIFETGFQLGLKQKKGK